MLALITIGPAVFAIMLVMIRQTITSKLLSAHKGITCAVSTVELGNMAFSWGEKDEVIHSRRALVESLGLELENGVVIACAHDIDIREVGKADRGNGPFDGEKSYFLDCLVTTEPDVVLMLPTADCVPLIIYDPVKSVLALVHAGWRNTDKEFSRLVVEYLVQKHQVSAENLLCYIGPCIAQHSYVFDDPVQSKLPNWQPFIHQISAGKYEIDLEGYNVDQLKRAGVLTEHIEVSGVDTCSDQNFFSHYRAVRTEEQEGRIMTVASLKKV